MKKPPMATVAEGDSVAFSLPAQSEQRPVVEIEMLGAGHTTKLRNSALTDEQIAKLKGWRTLPNGSMEIPYLRPDGSAEVCHDGRPFRRWRLSDQEIADLKRKGEKKPGKYRSPKGEGCRLYHSSLAIAVGDYAQRLADKNVPLRITEGELKTEAAAVHDPERVTVGLGGVNSWVDRYDGGNESRPLVDFDEIPLQGREVRLCFDSDLEKPAVKAALRKLAEWLSSEGAVVLIEILPNGLDSERLGLDDLINRHGREMFLEIASIARSPFKEIRNKSKTEEVWAFKPEPHSTRERNVYLSGMLGGHWRRSADARNHWQRWTGIRWEAVAGDDCLAAAVENFMELQGWQNRELNTITSLLAAFRRSIEPSSDAAVAGLLPFLNGVLRLADGELLPHAPEHGNNWVLPYAYTPHATCPKAEAFLLDRLVDSASVAVFRAFARGLLVGDRLKSFLEITGPSNTGKSVLANLLVALVGNTNTAAGTLQRLEDRGQRFETLKLRGRRLAIFSEAHDFAGQLQTLKALTGGDPIAAEVKHGRHLDFTFTGGVVLVGNGPIRASDPTGAVINRRRSLVVQKVVQASDERPILDPDGQGGWRGELAAELPGLVNWALEMSEADARAALARDVRSLARAEAEADALLATNLLAEWADEHLAWHKEGVLRVGDANDYPDSFLYPNYLRWLDRQGRTCRPVSLRRFKGELVDLLRDTLGLPLPSGGIKSGEYRERELGSVIPCLQRRSKTEESVGVIRHAFRIRIGVSDAERVRNGKTPAGNGWNGCNGSEQTVNREENTHGGSSYEANGLAESVPAIPSIPQKVSQCSAPVPQGGLIEVLNLKTGAWEPGWVQIGKGKGSVSVLCRDPLGHSRLIGKREIRPCSEAA